MCETEKASANLKEKLDEAEAAISFLRDEKATAACSIEKIAQDLEDALEQRTLMNTQLEALRAEHDALVRTITEFLVAFHSMPSTQHMSLLLPYFWGLYLWSLKTH